MFNRQSISKFGEFMGEEDDDIILIKGCLKNDRKAQNMLFRKYYAYGMSICNRYIEDKEEVSWVLSKGFLKVFDNLGSFDLSLPLKPWLKTILINTCYSFLKQNKKYKDFSDIEDLSIEDSAVDIESTMSYENLIAQIKTLSPAYRTVFNLYVIDGYSHFEISEMLGISVGASKSNLHKAKEKLKQLLEKNLGILSYAR